MTEAEREEEIQFTAAIAMGYSDLHEASLSLEIAEGLEHIPRDRKTLKVVRRELEKTRRLLHKCLMYVDNIERAALDLDEDEPDLP